MNTQPEEEDNILPFERPIPKAAGAGTKDGPDWLTELPLNCRFLATPKHTAGVWLDSYGLAFRTGKSTLLACESRFGPGYEFKWVDPRRFSNLNTFVEVLPDITHTQEGEKENNDEHNPP